MSRRLIPESDLVLPIALVAAMTENNVIGRDGDVPWRFKADLRRFRAVTMCKPIVMGRRTWRQIGRALDGRANIVVTRNRDIVADGALVAYSLEDALRIAEIEAGKRGANEISVIGGGVLFEDMIERADRLYITHIKGEIEGDTFFPAIRETEWREVSREVLPTSPGDDVEGVFAIYERRR